MTLPTNMLPRNSGGKLDAGVAGGPGDGRRAVGVLHHRRDVAEAVVRAAEAVVVAAADQQHDRPGVAVGVEQVALRVEGHAERVDLAVGEVLDPGAVEADAVGVAALQVDLVAVASLHGRGVGPAVVGVEPAVEAAAEGVVHAVGVAAELERPVEDLAAVGLAVAVGVVEELDVGDAEGDHAVLVGIEADGDVEARRRRPSPCRRGRRGRCPRALGS